MVCSADDLVDWRDFPKGLRVLLLDEDGPSTSETRLKLEAMDYIVTSYYNEKDALEAISKKVESFHVAIVEVTIGSSHGSFGFLEMAKDLPTVVISNVCCLTTMMKCIALGAAEFLQKPLSEDKLRNIWQHVVHKALNAGGNVLPKSLKPIKETFVSMLRLQSETSELKIEDPSDNAEKDQENDCENSGTNVRFSAPSTPQLIQGGRLLDDGECQEQTYCSTEKGSTENTKDLFELRKHDFSRSKSADYTCNNLTIVDNNQTVSLYRAEETAAEEDVNSADGSKTNDCSAVKEGSLPSSHIHNGDHVEAPAEDQKKKKSPLSINSHSHGNRSNRKRMKVDWTPELHRRFVQAVEQLGIDQAIPSKILEMMKVEGLTRHNIASHLQKFRMQRRHILPKDDDRRWQMQRDLMPRGYMQKPVVAFPPLQFNYGLPPNQAYPIWGHPSYLTSGIQTWGHAGFSPWCPPPDSWLWNTYPANHADAWGCPIVHPYSQCSVASQSPSMSNGLDDVRYRSMLSKDSYGLNPTEELIDEVVREAMSKPWLPLPLGLKPPSTDSVLAELHRKGIRTTPPPHSTPPPPH